MQIPDLPFLFIEAHTCTFVGCFGLGLYLGFRPDSVQQNLWWFSICTVVSPEKMTIDKSSICALLPIPHQARGKQSSVVCTRWILSCTLYEIDRISFPKRHSYALVRNACYLAMHSLVTLLQLHYKLWYSSQATIEILTSSTVFYWKFLWFPAQADTDQPCPFCVIAALIPWTTDFIHV